VLYCIAAWCGVLRRVAVCCRVLQCLLERSLQRFFRVFPPLAEWCVALCCSVLQNLAMWCSAVQYVAGANASAALLGVSVFGRVACCTLPSLVECNTPLEWRSVVQRSIGVLHSTKDGNTQLQCGEVWYSAFAVCCSVFQHVAVCCCVLPCLRGRTLPPFFWYFHALTEWCAAA